LASLGFEIYDFMEILGLISNKKLHTKAREKWSQLMDL